MSVKKTKVCSMCKGKGEVKITKRYMQTKDTRKLLNIMEKYSLTQADVGYVIRKNQSTVNYLLHRRTNPSGKIKPEYFELLAKKGYKE